jgi:adenosine deaminase
LEVLGDSVDAGCRHVELMVTLGYHVGLGRDPRQLLDGMAAAFRTAADLWGLSGGIIVEFDRPAGGEAAREIAALAADAADAGLPVLGVGNDGDPLTMPFAELAPGYELARQRGLKLCGHCDLPWDLQPALDLGLDRIDHGFSAAFDEGVLAEIVRRQVPLTICLTSNVVMFPGIYADFADHPLAGLVAAGANVTLNTDDGPFYYTDLAQEYRAAAQALGWSPEELGEAAMRSLRAAWLPQEAASRVDAWQREVGALTANPRLTGGLGLG